MKSQYWRITYCPSFDGPGVLEWVFKGNEEQLNKYLFDAHSCGCAECSKETNWWRTAQACEYDIHEIIDEEDMQ